MFLNGTAMSGHSSHYVIEDSKFIGLYQTSPNYRFFSVRDEFPGLFEVDNDGSSIWGELYDISTATLFDSLVPSEPKELQLGEIKLIDGQKVYAMKLVVNLLNLQDKIVDITEFGGWKKYEAFIKANQQIEQVLGLKELENN